MAKLGFILFSFILGLSLVFDAGVKNSTPSEALPCSFSSLVRRQQDGLTF
jgi:hypothetical protein